MRSLILLSILLLLTTGAKQPLESQSGGDRLPAEIIGKDGATMILIPAGEFQMGDTFTEGDSDELPVHTVYLNAFYMDKCEVTNAQYRKFTQATGHREPEGFGFVNDKWQFLKPWSDPNFNGDDQPVVCVSWEDASAYAKWAGKRLPTEAEWEKAARGGLVGKRYVWGDDDPPSGAGNLADESLKKIRPDWVTFEGYDDGYAYTAPVGSFSPNGYGLYDMAGNLMGWCADWYDKNYYSKSLCENPQGPDSGFCRVFRSGGWSLDPFNLRVARRRYDIPTYSSIYVGFRCAVSQ